MLIEIAGYEAIVALAQIAPAASKAIAMGDQLEALCLMSTRDSLIKVVQHYDALREAQCAALLEDARREELLDQEDAYWYPDR